jgi:hypothetical protein
MMTFIEIDCDVALSVRTYDKKLHRKKCTHAKWMHPDNEKTQAFHHVCNIWTCHYWEGTVNICCPVKAMRCPNYTTQPKTRKTTLF